MSLDKRTAGRNRQEAYLRTIELGVGQRTPPDFSAYHDTSRKACADFHLRTVTLERLSEPV